MSKEELEALHRQLEAELPSHKSSLYEALVNELDLIDSEIWKRP